MELGTGRGTNHTIVEKLGRFFYIIDYRTHRYEHLKDVPDYVVDAAPFFMASVIIEMIIGILKGNYSRHNIYYYVTNISGGMIDRIFNLMHRPLTLFLYCWVHQHYRLYELPWDSPITWWMTFLAVDFLYYWFHRATHEINILWAAHQMHHSGEDMTLGTALRQSIVQKYAGVIFYSPVALFVPPSIFYIHEQFNLIYQFWIHTEVVKTIGPLEYIFNTASHHRVHHGRNPYCIDKNYGGTLIIWDRLFNTFAAEDEPVAYGLVNHVETANPWKLQFDYYLYLFKRSWKLENWKDKLNVFFRAPDWLADSEKIGLSDEDMTVPEVQHPIVYRDMAHFNVKNESLQSIYVAVHFLIASFIFQEFFAKKMVLSAVEVSCSIGFFFWTLTSLGYVLENRSFWRMIECTRCFVLLFLDMYMHTIKYSNPVIGYTMVVVVRCMYAVSILLILFFQFSSERQKTIVNKNK